LIYAEALWREEDLPEAQTFQKADANFQSGEPLLKCWLDPHYRDDEVAHHP